MNVKQAHSRHDHFLFMLDMLERWCADEHITPNSISVSPEYWYGADEKDFVPRCDITVDRESVTDFQYARLLRQFGKPDPSHPGRFKLDRRGEPPYVRLVGSAKLEWFGGAGLVRLTIQDVYKCDIVTRVTDTEALEQRATRAEENLAWVVANSLAIFYVPTRVVYDCKPVRAA